MYTWSNSGCFRTFLGFGPPRPPTAFSLDLDPLPVRERDDQYDHLPWVGQDETKPRNPTLFSPCSRHKIVGRRPPIYVRDRRPKHATAATASSHPSFLLMDGAGFHIISVAHSQFTLPSSAPVRPPLSPTPSHRPSRCGGLVPGLGGSILSGGCGDAVALGRGSIWLI